MVRVKSYRDCSAGHVGLAARNCFGSKTMNLLKSILHNIGVLVVSFAFALIGVGLDYLFGIGRFYTPFTIAVGCLFLATGFLLRVWATYHS